MKKKTLLYFSVIISFLLIFSSCSEYQKVYKGNNYEQKYTMALQLYENGECYKSFMLLEDLMSYYRMSAKAEDVYYYYAKVHFCMQDYYLASYYFKRFTVNFPTSPRVEECLYMSALCTKLNSPTYNLDPTETEAAIDELQLFMDRFPESSKVDTANAMIDELRAKLEKKSFEQAKLYYKMERYNSAVVCFKNTLREFPDTEYREEIMFLIVKSYYKFAKNSVEKKKVERFENTLESYRIFADRFPNSEYIKEASNYNEQAEKFFTELVLGNEN